MSSTLFWGISQLVTPPAPGKRHGTAMRDLRIEKEAAMLVVDGRIAWLGKQSDWCGNAEEEVELGGRAVVPGLVDPHTHAVWAGDRLEDFEARCSGKSYEEILAAGGGIWHTIRETAQRSCEDLVELAKPRIEALVKSGATVIEVKSGYGFEPEVEIRMLEAVHALQLHTSAKLLPTLLIHICPEDVDQKLAYRARVCEELIPYVAHRKLASVVDIFVERHAWDVESAEAVLRCAQENGLALKFHTEQFNNVGGVELGLRFNALSVDHLEVCTADQCRAIGTSNTIATILPGVSLHLGLSAAPGRKLIEAGAAVALGTDLNPGSSPVFSMSEVIALATRLNGLSPAEALTAATVNAAAAIGWPSIGYLSEGSSATFVLLETSDWRDLAYTLGGSVVREVWIDGRKQV